MNLIADFKPIHFLIFTLALFFPYAGAASKDAAMSQGVGSRLGSNIYPLSNGNIVVRDRGNKSKAKPRQPKGSKSRFGSTPLLNELQEIVASDGQSNDGFGFSVDIDGDTAVVGAPFDDGFGFRSGAAYVFVRNGSSWTEQGKLIASDGGTDDRFGFSVAVSGDTIMVGAEESNNIDQTQGSVYVFTRSGTAWTQQAKLRSTDGNGGDRFGNDIDLDGTTAIFGAWGKEHQTGTLQHGAAYVFTGSGANWTQQAKLVPADSAEQDQFGWGVGISGNEAVIGAPFDDDNGQSSGSAYIFARNGTTWSQMAKLLAGDGLSADQFGRSASMASGSVVIGAYLDDTSGSNAGSAYVFTGSGASWTEQQKLTASDEAGGNFFGINVDIDDNNIVVGSRYDNATTAIGNPQSGANWVFQFDGSMWVEVFKLRPSASQSNDGFGEDVGLSGTTVISGAYSRDVASARSGKLSPSVVRGAAFLFDISLIPQSAPFDFDGDGRTDVSVYRSSEGNWYINRSTAGFLVIRWGTSTDIIAPADYDGDGKTDIAVWRPGPPTQARFYILNSNNFSLNEVPFGQTGDTPSVTGDWDGDGKADPAVYRDSAQGSQSRFFYLGSDNNPGSDITYLNWGTTGDRPARGDFDGDGMLDLAVFRPSQARWWIKNSSNGSVSVINWGLGSDILVAGDYDGDSITDLAVFRTSENSWYYRRSSNLATVKFPWGQAGDVLAPGDYDGDGKIDPAVYRPSNRTWYINQSGTGSPAYSVFGLSNDIPVPSSAVNIPN